MHEAFHLLLTDFQMEIEDDIFTKENVHLLFNIVEDYRIEEYIQNLKPGYWFNFETLHEEGIQNYMEKKQDGIKNSEELINAFFYFCAGHKIDEIQQHLFEPWIQHHPTKKDVFYEILNEIEEIFSTLNVGKKKRDRYQREYPTILDAVYAVKRLLFLLKKYNVKPKNNSEWHTESVFVKGSGKSEGSSCKGEDSSCKGEGSSGYSLDLNKQLSEIIDDIMKGYNKSAEGTKQSKNALPLIIYGTSYLNLWMRNSSRPSWREFSFAFWINK